MPLPLCKMRIWFKSSLNWLVITLNKIFSFSQILPHKKTSYISDFIKDDILLKIFLPLGTIGFENDKGILPNQAYLYKITKENISNPTIVRSGITNSNGMAWNKDNNKMYYIDTPTLKIIEYEFDEAIGSISSKYWPLANFYPKVRWLFCILEYNPSNISNLKSYIHVWKIH